MGSLVRIAEGMWHSPAWNTQHTHEHPRVVGKLMAGELAVVLDVESHGTHYIKVIGPSWVGWMHSANLWVVDDEV